MAADLFLSQLNAKTTHASVQAEAMIIAIAMRSRGFPIGYGR